MKPRLVVAVLALALAPAAHAAEDVDAIEAEPAGERDYDARSGAWNGLSDFSLLARGDGFEVVVVDEIDWDDLEANDLLVLLYPTRAVEANDVAAFVHNGGSLVYADDFGQSEKVFNRLAMLREASWGVSATRYYDDLPFAPIAVPIAPQHPLARGVDQLVTNYPAIFTEVRGAEVVFGFGSGQAVVVAGEVGAGRFVALGDPSVLINGMIVFPGNFRFATNLLRYFHGGRPRGRVVILAGDFHMRGVPSRRLDADGWSGALGAQLRDLDRWFEDINSYYLQPAALRALAIVAAALVALFAAMAVPLRRGVPLDGRWTRARPDDDGGRAVIAALDHDASRDSYLVPASALRDAINARLAPLCDSGDPLGALTASELLARVEARAGARARAVLAPLCETLRRLPEQARAATVWPIDDRRFVSRREFLELDRRAGELYRALEDARVGEFHGWRPKA